MVLYLEYMKENTWNISIYTRKESCWLDQTAPVGMKFGIIVSILKGNVFGVNVILLLRIIISNGKYDVESSLVEWTKSIAEAFVVGTRDIILGLDEGLVLGSVFHKFGGKAVWLADSEGI